MNAYRAVAITLVVLSAVLHSLFPDKPRITGPTSADAHYGEGPIYAFDQNQRKQVEKLRSKQGYVTREQIEQIMEDGSGSALLASRK